MDQNPKKKRIKISTIINILLPFDLNQVFNNIYYIIIDKNKIYFILWLLFFPITTLYCIINLFFIFYYIVYYYLILILNLIKRYKWKKQKKNYNKKIKYKKIKVLSNNNYIILLKKSFIEKSSEIGFNIFYTTNNLVINWKKNKKEMDINIFLYIIYVLILRLIIYLLTGIPFIIIKINTLIIKKIQTAKNIEFENLNTYIKFVWFNFLADININIESKIESMRIIILNNKIIFNPFEQEFLIYLKSKLLYLNLLKNSVNNLSESLNFGMSTQLINLRTNKNLIVKEKKLISKIKDLNQNDLDKLEKLDLDLNFEKNYTKKHLTVFFKSESGITFYKNETSKNFLWIYNKDTNMFEKIKLRYNHLGSLNKQLNTWYTPTIQTEEKNMITDLDLSKIIVNTKNQIIAKYNISAAMLIDSDDKLLKTQYLKEQNKYIITKENNSENLKTHLKNEIKELGLNDNQILDCFKMWEDFCNENKNIIDQIPKSMLSEFIGECLYDNTNTIRETTFFLLKK